MGSGSALSDLRQGWPAVGKWLSNACIERTVQYLCVILYKLRNRRYKSVIIIIPCGSFELSNFEQRTLSDRYKLIVLYFVEIVLFQLLGLGRVSFVERFIIGGFIVLR